jgi:hypothetical protein
MATPLLAIAQPPARSLISRDYRRAPQRASAGMHGQRELPIHPAVCDFGLAGLIV